MLKSHLYKGGKGGTAMGYWAGIMLGAMGIALGMTGLVMGAIAVSVHWWQVTVKFWFG